MAQSSQSTSIHLMNQTERPVYGRQPGKFISTASSALNQASKSPSMTPSMMNQTNRSPFMALTGGSSSMIEKEKRAIEKIKARQRKEVEQMMDYEL